MRIIVILHIIVTMHIDAYYDYCFGANNLHCVNMQICVMMHIDAYVYCYDACNYAYYCSNCCDAY